MTDVATLYVRNISPEAVARIKRRAEARGLTVGAYLEALESMHADMLDGSDVAMADPTDARVQQWTRWVLEAHNLGRVVD